MSLNVHEIVERLRPVDSPAAREAAFMSHVAGEMPYKVTFPAASIFAHPFTTVDGAYGSVEEFGAHAIEIERRLVADAIAAGARYVQFDFPSTPTWSTPHGRGGSRPPGMMWRVWTSRPRRLTRRVLRGHPRGRSALHICRGNFRSSWMCEGSLEPVAERVFGELPYDAFLVEWDDLGRDGGYEPIRHLRAGGLMVMGIISSKTRELEDAEDLIGRMEEAAAIVGGMDRLAISPQCGFASVMVGNETDEDAQWRKLELVGRVADRLWG